MPSSLHGIGKSTHVHLTVTCDDNLTTSSSGCSHIKSPSLTRQEAGTLLKPSNQQLLQKSDTNIVHDLSPLESVNLPTRPGPIGAALSERESQIQTLPVDVHNLSSINRIGEC